MQTVGHPGGIQPPSCTQPVPSSAAASGLQTGSCPADMAKERSGSTLMGWGGGEGGTRDRVTCSQARLYPGQALLLPVPTLSPLCPLQPHPLLHLLSELCVDPVGEAVHVGPQGTGIQDSLQPRRVQLPAEAHVVQHRCILDPGLLGHERHGALEGNSMGTIRGTRNRERAGRVQGHSSGWVWFQVGVWLR